MAEKSHWSAEPSSYRMSREHDDIWALVYDPTPGGRKNDDGTTTYSIRFPALVLSEYVQGPGKVAADLARILNSHDKLKGALKAARTVIQEDRDEIFDSVTVAGIESTMDEIDRPSVERMDSILTEIDAALASLQTQEEGR